MNLTYLSNANYFNTPAKTWMGVPLSIEAENFTFYFSSVDGSRSNVVTYPIIVENVNQATNLSYVSSGPLRIYAYSSSSSAANTTIGSSAIVTGFIVLDPDRGIDPVRVDVTTTSSTGKVTLNRDALPALDFSSLRYCFSLIRWQCKGDGYSSNSMTFVGQPSDVLIALNGLTYINTQPNIVDIIKISIYDGEGGDCLDTSQLNTGSIRSGCFFSSTTFTVNILGYSDTINNRAPTTNIFSIGYVLYAMIGLGGVIFIVLARCLFNRWRIRKLSAQQKEKEDADVERAASYSRSSSPDRGSSLRSHQKKKPLNLTVPKVYLPVNIDELSLEKSAKSALQTELAVMKAPDKAAYKRNLAIFEARSKTLKASTQRLPYGRRRIDIDKMTGGSDIWKAPTLRKIPAFEPTKFSAQIVAPFAAEEVRMPYVPKSRSQSPTKKIKGFQRDGPSRAVDNKAVRDNRQRDKATILLPSAPSLPDAVFVTSPSSFESPPLLRVTAVNAQTTLELMRPEPVLQIPAPQRFAPLRKEIQESEPFRFESSCLQYESPMPNIPPPPPVEQSISNKPTIVLPINTEEWKAPPVRVIQKMAVPVASTAFDVVGVKKPYLSPRRSSGSATAARRVRVPAVANSLLVSEKTPFIETVTVPEQESISTRSPPKFATTSRNERPLGPVRSYAAEEEPMIRTVPKMVPIRSFSPLGEESPTTSGLRKPYSPRRQSKSAAAKSSKLTKK